MQRMKNAKKLMMMLALSLTVVVMSCDEKANEDMMPQETQDQTANDGTSRLRQVGSETFDTSGMDNWSTVGMSDLPQAAQDYLAANHTDANIEEGYKTDTGEFVLLLDNGMVVIFNADGAIIIEFNLDELLDSYEDGDHDDDDEDWDEIPLDSLPQSVLDYVATNYPNSVIEEAASCPDNGHIIVFLDTDEILEFDADGNFIGLVEDDEDDDWEDGFEEVALDSLPQAIKDHMAANYATATAEEAWFDTTEQLYYILLESDIVLVYNADGSFVQELSEDDWGDDEDEDEDGEDEDGEDDEDFEEIKVEDLPQAIKDYMAANYANQTIEGAYWDPAEELYYIELADDLYVIFDKDGNFVEEFQDD